MGVEYVVVLEINASEVTLFDQIKSMANLQIDNTTTFNGLDITAGKPYFLISWFSPSIHQSIHLSIHLSAHWNSPLSYFGCPVFCPFSNYKEFY